MTEKRPGFCRAGEGVDADGVAASGGAWRWRNVALHLLIGRNPRRTLVRLLVSATVLTLIGTQVWVPTRIVGTSMEPTLRDGSWRVVALRRYRHADPAPGDLVCIRLAGRRVAYLKRVLAVPGDRIAFDQGRLFINGHEAAEPYVRLRGGDWTLAEIVLKEGEWFVAGDNRAMPVREHVAGVVARHRIIGGLL
jgi:signal peptidase I